MTVQAVLDSVLLGSQGQDWLCRVEALPSEYISKGQGKRNVVEGWVQQLGKREVEIIMISKQGHYVSAARIMVKSSGVKEGQRVVILKDPRGHPVPPCQNAESNSRCRVLYRRYGRAKSSRYMVRPGSPVMASTFFYGNISALCLWLISTSVVWFTVKPVVFRVNTFFATSNICDSLIGSSWLVERGKWGGGEVGRGVCRGQKAQLGGGRGGRS